MNKDDWFIEKKDDRTMQTVFGTAKIQKNGYYVITSRKEGNNKKKLHILVWERYYGKSVPKGRIIHHKNMLKTDNHIDNLILMDNIEHKSYHTKGENNPMYGVKGKEHPMYGRDRSGENNSFYKKNHQFNSLKVMSLKKNNTGLFRVSKRTCKKCKQGFIFGYRWRLNNKTKQISSSRLFDLKEKVESKKMPWEVIDQEKFNMLKKEESEIDPRARQL